MNTNVKAITILALCAIIVGVAFHAHSATIDGPSRSISPDSQWEYKCAGYGLDQCAPVIVKVTSSEEVLNLDQDANVNGPEASMATVLWSPDSKRFAFNFSPPHAHHTTYKTVAFYQLKGDKWESLLAIDDNESFQNELAAAAKKFLKKNHRGQSPDVVKVRNWSDPNTANAYVTWPDEKDAVAVTFKFDAAGKAKIINVRRLSAKELEAEDSD